MSTAPITQRGLANINGVAGSIDIVVYPLSQKIKTTQQWERELIKDVKGGDCASIDRNEHVSLSIGVKFMGDTAAHAAAPMSTGAGVLSAIGQPFLAPSAILTFSGFALAALNGTWIHDPGSELDMENVKVADGDLKMRRYADSTQQTLMTSSPS